MINCGYALGGGGTTGVEVMASCAVGNFCWADAGSRTIIKKRVESVSFSRSQ